jgi:hypothetical protein
MELHEETKEWLRREVSSYASGISSLTPEENKRFYTRSNDITRFLGGLIPYKTMDIITQSWFKDRLLVWTEDIKRYKEFLSGNQPMPVTKEDILDLIKKREIRVADVTKIVNS